MSCCKVNLTIFYIYYKLDSIAQWYIVCFAVNPGVLGSDPVLGKFFSSRRGKKGSYGRILWTLGIISGRFFDAFRSKSSQMLTFNF